MILTDSLPDKIKKAVSLLNDSKLSNYEISKSTHISQSTLGNYKNGKTYPTPANAEILIAYFDGVEGCNLAGGVNGRIRKIINENFNGSIPEFCNKLNLSQALVMTTLEHSKPSYGMLMAIIEDESLNINAEWLMTGRGEPFKSSNTPSAITENPSTDRDIKILDIRVCAGHGIGFDGEENKIIGYVNIPDFAGCYGITVYGDSMYDMYMPGDTIFVREIIDWKNIDNGQPHVIITNEDRLLKNIHIDYKEKTTTLSSYNDSRYPDGKRKYPDMMIDLDSDVKHIYKVVGKLARTQM